MKPCTCPRCDFFGMVALDLLALGDVEGANLASAEITWTHEDGSLAIRPLSECGSWSVYEAQWRGVTTQAKPVERSETQVTPVSEGYTDTWQNSADSMEVN